MSESNKFNHVTFGLVLFILIFSAVVALWVSISGEGPISVSNHYETSKYHESATRRIDATCSGLQGVALTGCKIQIEQSERENHSAQKDLRAQRYMAIWALFMALSAVGTLIVTVIGLHWIKGTLEETSRAVKAADDAVAVTRNLGVVQSRAYIQVTGYKIIDLRVGSSPKIKVTYTNCGQTPATQLSVIFNLDFIKSENEPVFLRHRRPSNRGSMASGVERNLHVDFSSQIVGGKQVISDDKLIEALISGEVKMRASGYIFYKDVFNIQRRTIFCFATSPWRDDTLVILTTPKGNRST